MYFIILKVLFEFHHHFATLQGDVIQKDIFNFHNISYLSLCVVEPNDLEFSIFLSAMP